MRESTFPSGLEKKREENSHFRNNFQCVLLLIAKIGGKNGNAGSCEIVEFFCQDKEI
jgi:hypothetical protein